MHVKIGIFLAVVIALLAGSDADAGDLRLARIYSDGMVLQRGKPVVIKGFADGGAEVAVEFTGQRKLAKANADGTWAVTLDPTPADGSGKPLSVRCGGQTVALEDVVVGDVLVFAGQSNIDASLGRTPEGRTAAADHRPTGVFRTIHIKTIPEKDPQPDLAAGATDGWKQVGGDAALAMSAAAFYLGRDLSRDRDVPLGVVDIDMGYHFATAWLGPRSLDELEERFPSDLTKDVRWLRKELPKEQDAWANGDAKKRQEQEHEQRKGQRVDAMPALGLSPVELPHYPSACFNAVLNPLRGLAVSGVLLQLGNDYPWVTYTLARNAGKITDRSELAQAWAQGYMIYKIGFRLTPVTLPMIPKAWQAAFGDDNLPIGWIMPPGSDYFQYAGHNRDVRELQRRIQNSAGGVDLIVPGMAHVPGSGQPADERLLAGRCGAWVRGRVFGEKNVTPVGPLFDRVEFAPSRATVHFRDGTARGLRAPGGALEQFEVAGADANFVPCTARIEGETVGLTSDDIHYIEFVRYGWLHKPGEGLVNEAGLPAVPFNTQAGWSFQVWPAGPTHDLPAEYSTPANLWPKADVTIVNGAVEDGNGGDSEPLPSLLGPTGIVSDPFGPNFYVHRAEPGSPAEGKVREGDLVYAVNGRDFGLHEDDKYREFAAAITHAETDAGNGRLVLGIRRAGRDIEVELKLAVLGPYSSTTPFFCPKSARIVENAERWIARRYRPDSGLASEPTGMLDTDLWFLMASGKPEYQGLVRRAIYKKLAQPLREPDPHQGAIPFTIGYAATLFGEYFHATGDANVLPYLENQAGWAAVTQIKAPGPKPVPWEVAQHEDGIGGWRTKYNPADPERWRSGYGLMPPAGMTCVMGMLMADEAGLRIDREALERGLTHFNTGRAEYAHVMYWYHPLRVKGPAPINPKAEAAGLLSTDNGKIGTAAALFRLTDLTATTEICSRYCVYAYNRTRSGHGGMFFNNFWTPIGAWASGDEGYKHFMQGQTWWRELFRRHDGSFNQVGRGGIGVAYALHHVAPKKRLRILGAPKSAFCPDAPAYLEPALAAHRDRDYATAEACIRKAMDEGVVSAEDLPRVEDFLADVRILNRSIEHDLAYTERMLAEGRHYYASLEVPQLKGVVSPQNPRLQAILAALESPEGQAAVQAGLKVATAQSAETPPKPKVDKSLANENWVNLTTEAALNLTKTEFGEVPEGQATRWRLSVLETPEQAPAGWNAPGFDDSRWNETSLPISWPVGHTAVLRCTFDVEDVRAIDGLRLSGVYVQQRNVEVYLNGALVAKLNNIGRGISRLTRPLTDHALAQLRPGTNTLAVITTHGERWGKVDGAFPSVINGGFGIRLDARKAGFTAPGRGR